MLKAVLFDLDGTLLPMKLEEFQKSYFSSLAKFLASYGYEPEKLVKSVWTGIKAMMKNDGTKSNEKAFWTVFASIYGEDAVEDEKLFKEYYINHFHVNKKVCGFDEDAKSIVDKVKAMGLRTALATSPIFPSIATSQRVSWAGLSENDFEIITTYENSTFAKPSVNYYKEIASKMGLEPNECLMVGNDIGEDLPAKDAGMEVFILTKYLINKNNIDISQIPHGDFLDLLNYIKK